MTNTRKNFLIEVTEYLIGTCTSIFEVIEEAISTGEFNDEPLTDENLIPYSEFSEEDLEFIDEQYFTCSVCGWNHSTEEREVVDDEEYCPDCVDNENETNIIFNPIFNVLDIF
jgi:hypothetical protein